MSHRFELEQNKKSGKAFWFSLILFAAIAVCFFTGMNRIGTRTDAEAKNTLEAALKRDIARCYALEGHYPDTVDYLTEHYGLTYDEDRFYIDYRVAGSNLMPQVTIIDRKD